MLLEQLQIYGWKESDENLLLASILTGDPLLLIGNHGCAKTHLGHKIGQALKRQFLCYDASKAMFEDILGYPNVERLKHGVVEYVPSPVTIWDKEIVLIDELNRAVPELQSKRLEIIRSRKIMGIPTQVKWVWAAMNPMSYSATNALDDALVGRFALFLYPPDVLEMDEEARIRVAMHFNGDDAPSLSEWTDVGEVQAQKQMLDASVDEQLPPLLKMAGKRFLALKTQMLSLAEFLAKFADLLAHESKGEVKLDGRRLGFIYRNLLANRAIELAKADLDRVPAPDFVASARYVVQSSIPVGLNDDGLTREETVHKLEICFDLLSSYFDEGAELNQVNLVYELFTTPDLMRKAELLLTQELGELALSKAWTDLIAEDRDITLLAYTALQIEARRPGTVPQELLASLSAKVSPERLSADSIPALQDDAIEYVDAVEALLQRDSDLERVIAIGRVAELVGSGNVGPDTIQETASVIGNDIEKFEALLNDEKGDIAA